MTTVATPPPIGHLLRDWRQRRRRSQLDLALDAGISTRHLSFVETGRSRPSAEMVLRIAAELEVPLRDRNGLLLAAGYAPVYRERPLDGPDMGAVRDVLQRVLDGHAPYPAAVVDRRWNLVAANEGVAILTAGVAPALLEPPANALRASLHPDGMAPRIANLGEWRAHLLHRLERQVAATADPALAELLDELRGYPGDEEPHGTAQDLAARLAVPLRLHTDDGGELAFLSTVTTFGTAVEITLSELAIESFFPADDATADRLRRAAA
jgi:transcriptional regulator with XRE-family HTH domain